MDTAALIKELTEARGASGHEAEVRGVVTRLLTPLCDEVRTDVMGNVIGVKRGAAAAPARPSIMLAGHCDEIALMVTQVEKGFLRVTQVGGFDPRVLFGQAVTVHGRRELAGLVVSVPPHFTDPAEREKPVPLDKLFVDVGLPPGEVEDLVRVGDIITLAARYTPLSGGYAACKSMDDRVCVAAMLLCMEELGRLRHSWDVYAVATVQEESTGFGAITGAYHLQPTAAVALDVTFGQQPGVNGAEAMKMDGGPIMALGPNIHPRIFDGLTAAARALEMPYQVEPLPGASGTDAWGIQVTRSGVPTGLVEIPLRNMHTAVETVCLRDVERTGRLMAEFISRLDPALAASLAVADAFAEGRPAGQEAAPCC
jgi:tetrahedral aminopeptidase